MVEEGRAEEELDDVTFAGAVKLELAMTMGEFEMKGCWNVAFTWPAMKAA